MEEVKPIPQPKVIKSAKIKETHEYALLERLKKLWGALFVCPLCPYSHYCCDGCSKSDGYLKYRIEGEHYPEEFLDEHTGCKLPIHLRSITCLTHICEERRAAMDKDYLDGIDALIEVMKKLEFELYFMEIK